MPVPGSDAEGDPRTSQAAVPLATTTDDACGSRARALRSSQSYSETGRAAVMGGPSISLGHGRAGGVPGAGDLYNPAFCMRARSRNARRVKCCARIGRSGTYDFTDVVWPGF